MSDRAPKAGMFDWLFLKLKAVGSAAVMIVWCLCFTAIAIFSDNHLALGMMLGVGITMLYNLPFADSTKEQTTRDEQDKRQ